MLDNIEELVKSCPNDEDKLYLLEGLSEITGFFLMNKKMLLVVKNTTEIISETIETEKLSLNTKVYIKAVANFLTFQADEYNYVMYKGEIGDADFANFIRICMIYVRDIKNISIKEFFYSIIDMFQLPREQTFKNLLGLFGELQMILYIYKNCYWDIAKGWHINATDKYDFALGRFLLEIKTTMSELLNVQLKHDQLFNKRDIYLGVVHLEESNSGVSLYELIDEINNIPLFAENFKFQISIAKELKRVSEKELKNKKFDIKQMLFINNNDIPTIHEIPDNITDISYKCALIGVNTQSIIDIYEKYGKDNEEE